MKKNFKQNESGTIMKKLQTMTASEKQLYIIIGAFVLLKIILHLFALGRYGFHCDELYFIVCGQRWDWGFVDQGPFTPLMARFSELLFGGSLTGFRVFSVLSGGATIWLGGLICLELGGRRNAVILTGLSLTFVPVFFRVHNMLHIPTFESLFWALLLYLILRLVKTENLKLWIPIGAVAGMALFNKPSMLLLIASLSIGFLLTPSKRKLMATWYLLIAGSIAVALALPFFLWQLSHDFPMLEFAGNVLSRDRGEFLIGQIFYIGPFNILIWLPGVIYCFLNKEKPYLRVFGIAYVTTFLLFLLSNSKAYYISAIYTFYFAAGAVFLESVAVKKGKNLLLILTGSLSLATGAIFMPLALPLLPIEKVGAYARAVTFNLMPNAVELYADYYQMMGWDRLCQDLKGAIETLSAEESQDMMILTGGYDTSSAVNLNAEKYGLPQAYSGHMNYYFWPPKSGEGHKALALDYPKESLEAIYRNVRPAGFIIRNSWIEDMAVTDTSRIRLNKNEYRNYIENFITEEADKKIIEESLIFDEVNKYYQVKTNIPEETKKRILKLANFARSHFALFYCSDPYTEPAVSWPVLKEFGFYEES